MKTLHINVTEKIATYQKRDGEIVCGNSDYQIQFTFDSEWDAYTKKTARFKLNGKHYDKDFSGNVCPVPIIRNTDKIEVGVFVEDLETTTSAEIGCRRSILCGSSTPSTENDIDYANEAKEAAERAAEEAREEVTRLVGELGVVQNMGDSPTAVMSQKSITSYLSQHDKRITNLEQGILPSPFETDDSVAYIKAVPFNALPFAEVSKVGGMTHKDGDSLKSAKVTELEVVGKNMAASSEDKTSTHAGITFTRKAGKSSVVVNGTGTADSAHLFFETFTLPAGTYTASVYGLNSGDRLYLDDKKGAEGTIVNYITTSSPKTFTLTETTDCFLQMVWTEGSTYKNAEIKVQVERGNTATEYVPYTKRTLLIPSTVQDLDGYGDGVNADCYNYIDWDKKQFIKRVGKVDMGTLDYVLNEGFFASYGLQSIIKKPINNSYIPNILAKNYETVSMYYLSTSHPTNEVTVTDAGRLYAHHTEYTDATTFKSAMSGVMLYYELAEPEITDISDILSADNYIEVEGSGTITAVNEGGYAVPTTITYQIKGATV